MVWESDILNLIEYFQNIQNKQLTIGLVSIDLTGTEGNLIMNSVETNYLIKKSLI